jgi:hypothetical protein
MILAEGLSEGRAMAIWNGIEELTDEDRSYNGSRFSVVQQALFANPYQAVWGAAGQPALPSYGVTVRSFLAGAIPLGRSFIFRNASKRALDSFADLRWGPDRKGFRRIVHPNGVCLLGVWKITEATDYSGYFRKGSEALIVARYSNCCGETRRGRMRSLSMVGKLYPTTNPDHAEPLRTASFMTQQDIGGDTTDYINDVELRNAPDTTALRRGLGFPVLLLTAAAFKVDKNPSMRQLYSIAELGKPGAEPTRAPTFMRLLVDPAQPRIPGESLDFRDEIMAQIYDRGVAAAKRTLTFHIEVTDQGETHGPPIHEQRTFKNWRRIGTMTFDRAVVSYNGDFVIHFHHPPWRNNQNDPATEARKAMAA